MSVSIDSSGSVLEDGFQHGELLSASYDDHGRVIVNIKEPMDPKVFPTALRASFLQWRQQGKVVVWLELPIGLGDLTETVKKEGFCPPFETPESVFFYQWIGETPSTIRVDATYGVGIEREDVEARREFYGEQPKWRDLPKDCLVEVFRRVGGEALFAIPFVYKEWSEACLDPMCWESHFPEHLVFSKIKSMEFIVDRCGGHDPSIMRSKCFPSEAIEYVVNRCFALKSLGLHHPMSYQQSVAISNQISKWANLETVTLVGGCHMKKILPQIGLHCWNFTELRAPQSYIGRDEASLIVTHLSKIKHLSLKGSTIRGETLVMIMQGCNELVSLDVRDCTGFRADDAEILQLASHIPAFKCEGSRDFENYRHMLFNGVPPQDIVIDWDHFFHNF